MKETFNTNRVVNGFAFSLTIFSGCAEKKAVVKDEAIQEQKGFRRHR